MSERRHLFKRWIGMCVGAASMRNLTAFFIRQITVTGGKDTGDPCEAYAHHGYNGIEQQVIEKIVDWIQ